MCYILLTRNINHLDKIHKIRYKIKVIILMIIVMMIIVMMIRITIILLIDNLLVLATTF